MSIQDNYNSESTQLLSPISETSPLSENKGTKNLYIATLAACLGAFSMGCSLGFSSPAGPQLTESCVGTGCQLTISVEDKSWFDGIVSIGALCGGIISGAIVGFLGYKTSLILTTLPYILGWFLITYAKLLSVLLCGRFLSGISIGMTSLIVPVYVAEIAPTSLRGPLGTCFQLTVVIGILFAYFLGSFISWEWLAITSVFFPIGMLIVMIFMPEAPRWLIRNLRRNDAISVLIWLRNSNENGAEKECQELENFMFDEEKITLKEFFQPNIYKPVVLTTLIMVFQQLCGINAVLFNVNSIFSGAMPSFDSSLAAIIIGVTQVLATLLSVFLIDKLGRKILLMISGSLMCVMLAIFGVYYIALTKNEGFSWLPLFCVIVYVIAFSCGYGPIPWVLMSELIPGRAKGMASGIAIVVNWSSVFLTTKEFADMEKAFHEYGTFWIFSAVCFIGVLFVWKFVPETKGVSLEDISKSFDESTKIQRPSVGL